MTAFIQMGITAYTSLKEDYEFQLMRITNQISLLTNQAAAVSEEMMNEIRSVYNYEAILTNENTADIAERIEAFNSGEFYAAYQTQLAVINTKEKQLEAEKQQTETKLQAVTTMLEGMEKRQESNLKKEVYNF